MTNLEQATFSARSMDSPASAASLKSYGVKTTLDSQPSAVMRMDESLSPASLDSVVIAEKDPKSVKYGNTSPINSVIECLDAEQVSSFFCNHGGLNLHYLNDRVLKNRNS